MTEGTTDTSGNLKMVSAAATAETPGENDGRENEPGVTDSNGNLMVKSYA